MNCAPQIKNEPESSEGTEYLSDIINGSSLKRRRTEDYDEIQMACSAKLSNFVIPQQRSLMPGHSFLHIRHTPFVYQTEDWKPKGCTMYLPLVEDVMVNTRNIEQISFETDQFFLADDKGNYVGAKPGNAIHLWRYDLQSRNLYISRSILFLKEQEFGDIRAQLETM